MMSELSVHLPHKPRRADAQRSCAAILDAACRVWSLRPEASVEEIAAAAGLTRQTVYAHYPSRELLLSAAIARATADANAAMDAAFAVDPPVAALVQVLRASWQTRAYYPFLVMMHMSTQEVRERHEPLIERIAGLIRRGQDTGDFDRRLSPRWLAAAMVALIHAAHEEAGDGRMTVEEAAAALEHGILRLFGVATVPAAPSNNEPCPRVR